MDEQGVLHTNFGSLCGRSAEAALDSRARACGECLSLVTAQTGVQPALCKQPDVAHRAARRFVWSARALFIHQMSCSAFVPLCALTYLGVCIVRARVCSFAEDWGGGRVWRRWATGRWQQVPGRRIWGGPYPPVSAGVGLGLGLGNVRAVASAQKVGEYTRPCG